MGFNNGGESVDWLLEMATDPMLEVINLFGFKDGAKAIEWLMNRSNLQERPSLSSAMNIPSQFPPKEFETPTLQPRGERAQFQGTGQRFGGMQQQVQFQSNGSGHQTEYQYLNANGGFLNQSTGVKLRREEAEYSNHAGNQLQSQYPCGHRGRQGTTHI